MYGRTTLFRLGTFLLIALSAWASCTNYGVDKESCAEDADCPEIHNDLCLVPKCVDSYCTTQAVIDKPSPYDPDGDCMGVFCDSHGNPLPGSSDDAEDDGDPCTIDECSNGGTSHSPVPCAETEMCVGGECVPKPKG